MNEEGANRIFGASAAKFGASVKFDWFASVWDCQAIGGSSRAYMKVAKYAFKFHDLRAICMATRVRNCSRDEDIPRERFPQFLPPANHFVYYLADVTIKPCKGALFHPL
ncbi:hypothetical protein AAE478_001926 [Parahypoxylon ruwenzoriense]